MPLESFLKGHERRRKGTMQQKRKILTVTARIRSGYKSRLRKKGYLIAVEGLPVLSTSADLK